MIVVRVKIPLEQAEYSALLKAALAELRNPCDQARYIIRRELERAGLLETEDNMTHRLGVENGIRQK